MKLSSLLKTNVLSVLLLVLFAFSGNAQKINGVIYDENKKPLADVEIINQKNNFVTVSNSDGSFTIKGYDKDVLKFIYPSKPTKMITVNNHKNIKVYFTPPITVKDHHLNGNPLKNKVIGQVISATDKMTMPGVYVVIKGTTKGVQTNFDGYYGIDAEIGDVLEFHYLGAKTVRVVVNNKIINVALEDESAILSDVVVEGYSSTKTKAKSNVASITVDSKSVEGTHTTFKEESGKSDKSVTSKGNSSLKAGQLTAGEVNDFSHYEYWQGLTETELNQWKNHWKLSPKFRYSISLKNEKGFPIINRTVHLKNEAQIIWTARTDNTGRAELWYNPNDLSTEQITDKLQITDDKEAVLVTNPKEFHEGINFYTYPENCVTQNKINVAFMIDATGSMGDEISYLQAELYDVIGRTKKEFPEADLSMGSVFYRDHGDEYLLKNFDFTASVPNVISFIKKQHANGGGDFPEAVIEGLEASIDNMNWDDDARAKLLFVLLDAPPHYSEQNIIKLQNLTKKAAAKGIRIIPIAASGIDKSTEYLMRAMALETNGTYLFITNHSGIGNNHIEPSTESYKVEMLNDLILRVILQFASVNHCKSETANYSKNTKIEDQLTTDDLISFKYFPNPTNGVVNVTLNKEASELYLFDATGKLILYKTEKSNEYKIDLSELPTAIYYLKVVVEDKELFGKIIKQI